MKWRRKRSVDLKYEGMYDQPKYRGFQRGICKEGDEEPKHGPVKVIFSKSPCPVVDEPTWVGMRAGELRMDAPKCELILRDALRRFEPQGIYFQHSVAMFGYIADFYCPGRNLIIEVDGAYHRKRRDKDLIRDMVFRSNGIQTLRFPSSRVYSDLQGILYSIALVLKVEYAPL